ncbi:2'-5' RNA ligase family protein [Sulfidibacter corallicola]|uniref:2'-5' RNA ligase family protein n=1 Tax=Sulfidibacter corallicola TaxID=2818388 RepID=A0A8A4TMX5_SULCO|nr:2'-5' RNA ligase family protein [Sulfidibacter corallicola]QTD50797.1 2'-5' RNA ligase family protein [Sulfidibacter corallicola]
MTDRDARDRGCGRDFAFWLMPGARWSAPLAKTIDALAVRHGARAAGSFAPHITLYGGKTDDPTEAVAWTDELAKGRHPLPLNVSGIDARESYFQTLFLDFAITPSLTAMFHEVVAALGNPKNYELRPHLSLLYADMSLAQKRREVDRLMRSDVAAYVGTDLVFDRLALVAPNDAGLGWRNLSSWRVLASADLA